MAVDVVGVAEIAERLGVSDQTVVQWQRRGLLPKPTSHAGDRPTLGLARVEEWARATGLLEPQL